MSMSIKASPDGTYGEILVNGATVAKLPVSGNAVIPGLVGTVSQSGGVPTGAIIERGSNANGEYVRFADGTQICTLTSSFTEAFSVTWTFPATFSRLPCIQVNENHFDYNYYYTCTYNDNSNFCSVFRYRRSDNTPTTDPYYMRILAVGRWF